MSETSPTSAPSSGAPSPSQALSAQGCDCSTTQLDYVAAALTTADPSGGAIGGDPTRVAHQVPDLIGDYRVLRTIGQGGMGIVYEAIEERLGRRVALKVVRPGWISGQMLRRFEYEAAVLARLDHPGIARIYHAGIFDSGAGPQPYFAMEFVEGRPLDEHVQQTKPPLKLRQRVQLLHQVCHAVQHAHARGVLHRDLKPDNILVTAEGQPKILDFGIARAIDADTKATSLHTESGQIMGTVPYMAPEQIRGDVHELDAATDVYALGVIAYELLAGRMPYAVKGRPLPEAARVICEDEPGRLSSIDRSFRGDVETIVQKALEKDRTRRYASAGELAVDVKRYLDYEPITARPPSTWYNLRKFARRNKALVGGVATVLVALVLGLGTTTWQAIRATRAEARAQLQQRLAADERDVAQATLMFMKDVIAKATPETHRDTKLRDQIVQAMILPAAENVGKRFRDRPLIEASVRETVVTVLHSLGRADRALPHAEAVFSIRRRELGEDHADTINALSNYALQLDLLGRSAEAEPLHKEAVERGRRVLGGDHPEAIGFLTNYAVVLKSMGRAVEAEPLDREALERRRRVHGEDHLETIKALNNHADVLQRLDRAAEAEPLLKKATEHAERALGADHPITMLSLNNLAVVVRSLGRSAEAEPLFREALERRSRVLGDDHPETISTLSNYARVLDLLDRTAEAEPLFQEVLERRRRVLGENHPSTIAALNGYAVVLMSQDRAAEAEPLFRNALELGRRFLGEDHWNTIGFLHNVGVALLELNRVEEAEPLFRDAVSKAVAHPSLGPKHRETKRFVTSHAKCLDALGLAAEAAALRTRFGISEPARSPAPSPATQPATWPGTQPSTPSTS